MKGMKHMSKNRVGSGAGCAAVVGFLFSLLVLTVAGCKKADLPPEQVAVDVMTRCVMGMYEGLDSRLTGDIKNFVSKDRELRNKGRGWFSPVKSASFSVIDVKVDGGSAIVRLKAVLDGKTEEMPVRLEMSKDGKWKVFSFNDDKQGDVK